MALPNLPWATSTPTQQDTPGVEQPDLTNDTYPGAQDGHRFLVQHLHALRDKLQNAYQEIGTTPGNQPAGSLRARVATLEASGGSDEKARVSGTDTTPNHLDAELVAGAGITKTILNPSADEQLQFAADFGSASGTVCEGDDARLSDNRTPNAHAATHGPLGSDSLDVTDYPGLLADAQTPLAHAAAMHASGGTDELSVTGLVGVLGTKQDADKIQGYDVSAAAPVDGQGLVYNATATEYQPATIEIAPVTTKGDVYTFSTTKDRLPVGNNGEFLQALSTEPTGLIWAPAPGNPTTAKGDLVTHDGGQTQRLIVGTDGQHLVADSAESNGIKWADAPAEPLTTKGDLYGFDTAANRIAIGTNGQVLEADSAQALGLKWAAKNPLTTKGDILSRDTSADVRVGVGTNNQVLMADSAQTAGIKWANKDPMTTKGDLFSRDSSGDQRLGVGSDDQVLTAASAQATGLQWSNRTSMTTKGDLYTRTASGYTRLAVGADTQVLTADAAEASGLKWAAASGGSSSPLTTKGDLWGFSTLDARVPVGSNGAVLKANSAQALGVEWAEPDPLTTKGDIMVFSTDAVRLPVGTNDYVLTADSTAAEGVAWKVGGGGGGGLAFRQEEFTAAGGDENFTLSVAPAANANALSSYNILYVMRNAGFQRYQASPTLSTEYGYTHGGGSTKQINMKSLTAGDIICVAYSDS